MNQGILRTGAEFVLLSDADIIWNEFAIAQLHRSVYSAENLICSVAKITETNLLTAALKRDRCTYRITHYRTENGQAADLAIEPATAQNHRPGCGLIMNR